MLLNPEALTRARQPYLGSSVDRGCEAAGTGSQPLGEDFLMAESSSRVKLNGAKDAGRSKV